jgi:hypothetical protein
MPRGEFKHGYWFFADTPNIARNCALFEKIDNGERILTDVSNIGEVSITVVSMNSIM